MVSHWSSLLNLAECPISNPIRIQVLDCCRFSKTFLDWLSTFSRNLGVLGTAGVKLTLHISSHFEIKGLTPAGILGDSKSFWRITFGLAAILFRFPGFNLFRFFDNGDEIWLVGCLLGVDAGLCTHVL